MEIIFNILSGFFEAAIVMAIFIPINKRILNLEITRQRQKFDVEIERAYHFIMSSKLQKKPTDSAFGELDKPNQWSH